MSEAVASGATAVDYDPFAATAVARVVPTTEAQREMWLADRLSREASLAYNESVTLHLEGNLNVEALQASLRDLATRHEALRSVLSEDGLSLFIASEGELNATLIDLGGQDAGRQRTEVERLRVLAVEQPFDLVNGPLARAQLVRLAATKHELIITGHHIVCDGWSFGVLSTELMKLYASYVQSGGDELPPVSGFGDYALAQSDAEHLAASDAAIRYWVSQFDAGVPTLDLPVDRARAALRTFSSRRLDLAIDAALLDAVRKLGAKNGSSLFATLFSVFSATIGRIAGSDDLVVGVPAAGQNAAGLETLVGHCVNLLPIRVQIDFEQDVTALLKGTRKRVLDAYDHQACTFGTLLGKLHLERDPSRLPLVSVLFNLDQSIDPASLSLGGLAAHLYSNPRHFENFELFLNASQIDGRLVLECQYNTDLFDEATVARWLALYRTALQRAVTNPSQPLAEVLAPTAADVELLAKFNCTAAEYPRTTRIEAQIARQVAATPDAVAVRSGSRQLTYRELDDRANALAAQLRARGVNAGDLVGLFCGRNEHMIAGLYGILKSGAGYVPLDPTFPAERLQFMTEDGGLKFVVSDASVREAFRFAGAERVAVDELPAAAPVAPAGMVDDVAYVIYTSGSTGKPKGVRVPHRTVSNLLASVQREPGMDSTHRVLSVTTLSFDIAVSEVIAPLTVGARIVIAERDQTTDGEQLRALIESEQVNFIDATPSTWRLLLAAGWTGSQRVRAICTGEPLPPDLGKALIPLVGELWNGYGPTETTVWSSFHRVERIDGPVPIGHPVANTQIHIVDGKQRTLPVGVVGELFIGGDGVTLGYLARPELTAERFLPDPHRAAAGGHWYRTGDLGRWRADGVLECLGRIDHQVKLRGYRIELGEIEANLLTHPSVARAVVITREDQPADVRLVAYVVHQGAAPAGGALRDHLRLNLPDYMIPQHFVTLPAIPLLPNGKLDRRSLPKPDIDSLVGGRARIPPRTPLERQVLEAMEQVLNLPGLGINDNFFALGGHSLLAAKLTARLNQELQIGLPLRTVFESPTAGALASAVERARHSDAPQRARIVPRADQTSAPLTLMQERIRFVEEMFPGRVTYNTPSAHRLRGPMDVAAFERALNEIVRRQPSLRTSITREAGGWVQRVQPELNVRIAFEDLSLLPESAREGELMKRLRALIDTPMNIYSAPLFRSALFRMDASYHVFFFMPHHIIWDGWSFDLLYQEMAAAYPAALKSQPSPLPALPITYADYAEWHARWMEGDEFRSQLAFWKKRFTGIEMPRALPTDHPRRPGMTGNGEVEWVQIDSALAQALHQMARRLDATINMVTMALYSAMLAEAVGGRSVVVGMPVRGRLSGDVEPIMGFFNNMLPIPFAVDESASLAEWVRTVKRELMDTFSSQDVPFERLGGEPEFAAYSQKAGFYQGLFSFQDARERVRNWGGLEQENLPVMQGGATEDFGLWLMEGPNGLTGGINFNADLFTRATAEVFRKRFLGLLRDAVARPDASLRELLAHPSQEQQAFAAWRAAHSAIEPGVAAPALSTAAVPVSDKSSGESALAQIWSALLGLDAGQIQPTDNFFDLGGSSLLAMQAVAETGRKLGLQIDPRRYVFESLRQLAAGAPGATLPAAGDSPATAAGHAGLAGIWGELLGLDAGQIQSTDNFFDLGGSSLLAMRAVAEGERKLGLRIDPRRYVFESLGQLAVSATTAPAPAAVAEPASAAPVAQAKSKLFGLFGRGKS